MNKAEIKLWIGNALITAVVVCAFLALLTLHIELPPDVSTDSDEPLEPDLRIQALELENDELNQRIRQLEISVALAQDDAAYCKEMVVHLGEIVREERAIRFYETQNIVGVDRP
jgi:hypothetical protein